jgi:hypothetical protein
MTAAGNITVSAPEPNGKAKNELCLLANYSQAFNDSFGWADANCNNKYIFMCRIMSKRQPVEGLKRPRLRSQSLQGVAL